MGLEIKKAQSRLQSNLLYDSHAVTARVGFESGEQFFVHSAYAEIRIQCQTPSDIMTTTYDCHESILLPTELDFFNGPQDTRASKVTLVNSQDPRTKRIADYDPKAGQSTTQINLWMRSVLQRPLLNLGTNLIEYELFEGNASITKGTFLVSVTRGNSLNCKNTGSFQSNKIEDCQNPQRFCAEFIRVNNYCRP
jgi:hypothetical protein